MSSGIMLTKKALLVENFGSAQKREALYSCSPQFQYAERINPDLKAQKKKHCSGTNLFREVQASAAAKVVRQHGGTRDGGKKRVRDGKKWILSLTNEPEKYSYTFV